MTKIMLVEDDKSLREIYGVRLLAEGYDIVSAGDGEEALAMAIKERPQLIISDVMMPKVSGYDMLDILRSTTETKNIRVIMMTALSSEEQRARAESLGADRYLVKSQVGIEDVVRVVHEVLEDTPEAAQKAAASAVAAATPAPTATTAPTGPTPPAPTMPGPGETPSTTPPPAATPVGSSATNPANPAPAMPVIPERKPVPSPVLPEPEEETPKPASLKTRIIQPLNDPNTLPVNINDLLDKELAKEAGISDAERPAVESVDQEKAQVEQQLQSFLAPEPTPVPVTAPAAPTPPPAPSLLPTPGVTAASTPEVTPVLPPPPVIPVPLSTTPSPTTPSAPVNQPASEPSASELGLPTIEPTQPLESPLTPAANPEIPDISLPEVPKV